MQNIRILQYLHVVFESDKTKLLVLFADKLLYMNTVNSLMFARDLFGDFRDHIEIAKINTRKHKSCT